MKMLIEQSGKNIKKDSVVNFNDDSQKSDGSQSVDGITATTQGWHAGNSSHVKPELVKPAMRFAGPGPFRTLKYGDT